MIPQTLKAQAEAKIQELGGGTDEEHLAEIVKASWDFWNVWDIHHRSDRPLVKTHCITNSSCDKFVHVDKNNQS